MEEEKKKIALDQPAYFMALVPAGNDPAGVLKICQRNAAGKTVCLSFDARNIRALQRFATDVKYMADWLSHAEGVREQQAKNNDKG